MQNLLECLSRNAFVPERNESGPFVFSVDHCFGIKGQGTVMTGTVLQGSIKINDVRTKLNFNMIKKTLNFLQYD